MDFFRSILEKAQNTAQKINQYFTGIRPSGAFEIPVSRETIERVSRPTTQRVASPDPLGEATRFVVQQAVRPFVSAGLTAMGEPDAQPVSSFQKLVLGDKPITNIQKAGERGDLVIGAGQDIIRSAVSAGMSAIGAGGVEATPESEFTKSLIGERPVTGLSGYGAEQLSALGASPDTSKKFGLPAGLGFLGLNVIPGLPEKEIASALVKKFGKEAAEQILKEGGQEVARQALEVGTKDEALRLLAVNTGVKNAEEKFVQEQALVRSYNKKFEPGVPQQKPSFFQQVKETLQPMKYQDPVVRDMWKKRVNAVTTANELANEEFRRLEDLRPGIDSMVKYQQGGMGKDWNYATRVKQTFDSLFNEARDRGLDVGYRENYLPQVYANTSDEVTGAIIKYMKDGGVPDNTIAEYLQGKALPQEFANALKLSPSFTKERAFPTYEVAMRYGLTPKYAHPAQLAAYYRNEMEKSLANRRWIDDMKEQKVLSSYKLPGYKAVEIPFSNDELFAEKRVANALNRYFRDEDNLGLGEKFVKGVAISSRRMQELVLSGGVPATNANFFTIGQVIKDATAAEKKALGNVIISNSDSATKGWFRANQSYITKMAEEGIDLSRRIGNWDQAYKQLSSKSGLGRIAEVAGSTFDSLFNKKTFQSFMPMQAVSVFKSTFDSAISKGLSEQEARRVAAETTRAWAAIPEDWGRGKGTEELLTAVFFAPKFRESLIHLFGNTIKSMSTDIRNPAFAKNRKFIIGLGLSYGLYNMLNKKLNGNYMWENESGKEFDLKIPYGDGKFFYVAWMPSVLAFPRNMISGALALTKLDVELAGQKFGSLFSMPIKLVSEIASNRDYFGRPIFNEDDSRLEKLKTIAMYIGITNYNHPYVQGIYNMTFAPDGKKKDWYEVLSKMAEMPIKFNTQDNINKGIFYDAVDKQKQKRAEEVEKVREVYDQLQILKAEGRKDEADRIYYALDEKARVLYDDIKQSEKTKATNALKIKLFPLYEQLQEMKQDGKQEEADAIYNELSQEEKRVYQLIKKQFQIINE